MAWMVTLRSFCPPACPLKREFEEDRAGHSLIDLGGRRGVGALAGLVQLLPRTRRRRRQCNLFRINGPLLSKGAGGGSEGKEAPPPAQLSPREQHVPRARINGLRRISRTPLHSTQHLLILAKLETSDDKSFRRMALSMGLGGRA